MAWIVAGIVGQASAEDVWRLLGLLEDDSAGATWKADHGLITTAFRLDEADSGAAKRRAVARFERIALDAGLGPDTVQVLTCEVSPPSSGGGWEWPAELS